MADNTTTYTAEVDINVNGGEKLQETGEQAEQAASGFVKLQLQIRQTQKELQAAAAAGDKVKFNQLRNQLDDLEEGLEKVQFQAKQFDDQLASLPGPAGAAGNALKQVDGAFKLIVANPIIATIGAIVGLFLALRESLQRTEEGQQKLNKITQAFEKIMNGLFAVIEPIAMLMADFALKLLQNESVMKALSFVVGILSAAFTTLFKVQFSIYEFIINNFIIAFQTLAEAASGAGKVIKGVFTFDLDLIKQGATEAGDAVTKGLGKLKDNVVNFGTNVANAVVDGVTEGFNTGSQAFIEGTKRLTDEEKKALEEANKKKEEAAKKAAEEAKKREEQRLKDLEAANKVQTEAYLATLAERDKEIYKLGEAHNARMLALEKAGIADKTAVAEQYRIELAAINKKYDDQAAKEAEDKKKEEEAKAKEAADKAREGFEKEQADKLLRVETSLELDALTFDQRKALIDEKEKILLSDNQLTENQRTAIQKAAAKERANIDMAELEAKAEIQNAYLDLAGQFGSLLQQIAGKNKKVAIAGIIIEQAASIGKIIANTAVANAKAVAAFPLTGGAPWTIINTVSAALGIASTIAGAAKSISQINSADNGNASASGTTNLPRPQVASPTAGGVPQIQTQVGGGANPTAQIADTLAQASGKPVKAYVVAQEVSSAQAFDRRTNVAATF